MPVSPTYPGLYIEELPSTSHPITPAPTSVAVFVGYTHPFKTRKEYFVDANGAPKSRGKAVPVFSFTEYEREFGGLYNHDKLDANVARAVYQFFLNGGSVAYVVPIMPRYWELTANGANPHDITPAFVDIGGAAGIRFTALELTDSAHEIKVTVNVLDAAKDVADILITCDSRAETFRGVKLFSANAMAAVPSASKDVNFLLNRLAGSSLVKVEPVPPAVAFPFTFTAATGTALVASGVSPSWTAFDSRDFFSVFQEDGALDKIDVFNLLVLPGVFAHGVLSQALAFCERKHAFLIMDPPPASADGSIAEVPRIQDLVENLPKSTNGALYFPPLNSLDPLSGKVVAMPPSGFVAGIYARTDNNRGVWKAPAGLETLVANTTGVVEEGRMTDPRQGTLNPLGVNCLRTFPGIGTVVFGARTLTTGNPSFTQWRYVPVRRTALFIEQTLLRNLGWVVFEPNDEPLWTAIRISIEGFMLSLFRQNAFQGETPSQAFQVKCDSTTTTQQDIDLGIVNIVVGFRPLKPAEFVIIKIAQLAGQVQA